MEEQNVGLELEDASRLARLGSALIDMLLILIVTMPVAYFLGVFDNPGEAPPPIGTMILLAVVNLCFIFGKERRCIHDKIAGTKVVQS